MSERFRTTTTRHLHTIKAHKIGYLDAEPAKGPKGAKIKLSCGCVIKFAAPIPRKGNALWCRNCDRSVVCEGSA